MMVENSQGEVSQCEVPPTRESITGDIPNTLELLNLSLLSIAEEYQYKNETAHDLLLIHQAVEQILKLRWAEAKNQIEIRKAELRLATLRENQANHRAQYFCRLCEVASEKVSNAELQAGMLRVEGEKAGFEQHESSHRVRDPGSLGEDDLAVKLD